jgi:calcineurin-like phosphoesterase family protein
MNEALIAAWNSVVKRDDLVYHMGDFILGHGDLFDLDEIVSQLNGWIMLVPGNHDTQRKLDLYQEGALLERLDRIHEIKKPHPMVMSHFPLAVWHQNHKGSWMLHGHAHGYHKQEGLIMDVGVDTHPEHRPYHYDEVAAIMATKKQDLPLHHGVRNA